MAPKSLQSVIADARFFGYRLEKIKKPPIHRKDIPWTTAPGRRFFGWLGVDEQEPLTSCAWASTWLSIRTANSLRRGGIATVGELLGLTVSELRERNWIGDKAIVEIDGWRTKILTSHGYSEDEL